MEQLQSTFINEILKKADKELNINCIRFAIEQKTSEIKEYFQKQKWIELDFVDGE